MMKKIKKPHAAPHSRHKTGRFFSKILKKSRMPLAISIIILAIVFSVFRALTPWAKQYKVDVEHHLSLMLGQPVTINDLETSWYWFQPVLKMNEVTLSDAEHHVLTLNKLLVGINLLSSLWHWQIQPGVLYVADVHLTLRQVGNHWDVDGLSNDKQSMTFESASYLPVLSWVLAQQKIIIKNVSAMIHFSDKTTLSLRDLNVTTLNKYGHYRLKGSAWLAQETPTALVIIADMQLNPEALKNASGHAYLSVKHVLPAQWQGFFPNTRYHVRSGVGDIELWLDLVKGHFLSLQSTLELNDIVLTHEGETKRHLVQSLKGNLAWRTTAQGWQFTSDQMKWHVDGVLWPENALLLDYNKSDHAYRAFVKNVLLEPLLAMDIPWPGVMQDVLARHPKGSLQEMQMVVKKGELDSILTRFSQLGWTGQHGLPSVSQLSGVLSWQPTEGRLELDSEKTTLTYPGRPAVTFEQLNANVDWKQLSNGLRISMDRFVLNRPDLVISAAGTIDEPLLPTANLRMTAEFSAKNAEKWLDYIPAHLMKPKLDAWIRNGVKQLKSASGRLVVNGALADFPFDKQSGEFSINTYLTGLDLIFADHWPLGRDIDAHLQVINRTLDADVFQANLKGIPVENVNVLVKDIGLGREALLIRGQVTAPADKIKSYVLETPIGQYVSLWKKMDIKDTLGLNLQLEIPLYPESDHVLARGALAFDNNQVIIHHALNDIAFDELTGTLLFDEHGLNDSALHASLAGEPLAMHIGSIKKPKPYTQAIIEGSTSIDLLRRKFPLPLFEWMNGHLKIKSVLKLTDNPHDFDQMQINTSMEGVSVDLPSPLGKTTEEISPLSLKIDFNAAQTMQIGLQYKDLNVQAKTLNRNNWSVKINEQNISADLQYALTANTLSGTVDKLYLSDLFSLKNRMKSAHAPLTPRDIPNLNLVINTCKLDNIDLGQVSLKSTSSPTQLKLEYCKIKSPEYLLTVQGDWTHVGKKDTTHVQADLQLSDLGQALARWDILPAVEAHRGQVTFKGDWPGAIHDFSLAKVNGEMNIILRGGRITHLDKATEEKLGLGKLLSVLSLQTIPRRLQLDFSDLSKGGYSFDVFQGRFVLKNGVMTTQDSYLDGPVAYASMKGDLDVVNHLYDVDLRVSPYIMASLPIVVTIAGGPIAGPIAGFATWVASKLINKGLQQISAYTYKISGPWLDPIVQQVHIYKKKEPVANQSVTQ